MYRQSMLSRLYHCKNNRAQRGYGGTRVKRDGVKT